MGTRLPGDTGKKEVVLTTMTPPKVNCDLLLTRVRNALTVTTIPFRDHTFSLAMDDDALLGLLDSGISSFDQTRLPGSHASRHCESPETGNQGAANLVSVASLSPVAPP